MDRSQLCVWMTLNATETILDVVHMADMLEF